MRGIGGPLLTIGDLLSDVGEENITTSSDNSNNKLSSSSSIQDSDSSPRSLDLTKFFQENYDKLNEALDGSDHSWTALTLKLCTALETANKLVQSTNADATALSEKVGELEKVIKRGDSAIASAKAINIQLNQKEGTSVSNQYTK